MNRTKVINKLIADNGYESYLEIGVYDGKNFQNVKCDLKVGIDPNLPASLEGKMGLLVNNSDTFFEQLEKGWPKDAPERKFDLIFIDGDHEASQVEKDIVNAYKSLNKGGMLLLHDCNPPTYESQVVPRVQGEYCGTVWRSVVGFKYVYGDKIKTGYFDDPHGLFAIYKTGRYQVKEWFSDMDMTYEEFSSRRKELLGI